MDEYLKRVLEQIRCKKARPYIRQELKDHMVDQIEANIHAGMNYESAERAAVRDMGDPVETGISLDRIHRPQIAWKLLVMMILISVIGILIHIMIYRQAAGSGVDASARYAIHVLLGIAVMMILYFLDYTVLVRFSKVIAITLLAMCLLTLCFGATVNGMRYFVVFGGKHIPMQPFMLFYVPVYGGILYKYHGMGYKGLMKAIIWMMIPVILVWRLPGIMTAGPMLISMLIMLTIVIQKGWFIVQKKKVIGALWGVFLAAPTTVLLIRCVANDLPQYQKHRIQAVVSDSGDANYLTTILRSFFAENNLIGSSGADVTETLPGFNTDYILAYLSSTYGMIMAILICCVFTVLILSIFNTVMRQKNQSGMIMGCGCGMIFLTSFLINVLENTGALPPTTTFLPFLSAGGSYIVVSYGLMGIVLSIYRYKNIYPRHVEVSIRQNCR